MSCCINRSTGKPKRRFDTRSQAKVKLRSLKATSLHLGADLHVYRCDECGYLHIGHDRVKKWAS